MFNTLPSNSVAGGASSASGGIQGVPILFPPVVLADRYDDIQSYYDDDTADKIAQFGPRYTWVESSASHTTAWVDLVSLTGPGVIQFLAIWEASSTEGAFFGLRIVIDGTPVIDVTDAWSGNLSSSVDSGYIPIGDVQWNNVTAPLYTPSALENIPYAASFQVQVNCTTTAAATVIKALYRAYDAK